MATTTAAAIRDRISTVITALVPSQLASDRFIESRNEYEGDFKAWARAHKQACLRRFQVRSAGERPGNSYTNTTESGTTREFQVIVAYPQTHRYGDQAALDRDDVADADMKQIATAIGQRGKSNFEPGTYPDARWIEGDEGVRDEEAGDGVDFYVLTQTMWFYETT